MVFVQEPRTQHRDSRQAANASAGTNTFSNAAPAASAATATAPDVFTATSDLDNNSNANNTANAAAASASVPNDSAVGRLSAVDTFDRELDVFLQSQYTDIPVASLGIAEAQRELDYLSTAATWDAAGAPTAFVTRMEDASSPLPGRAVGTITNSFVESLTAALTTAGFPEAAARYDFK